MGPLGAKLSLSVAWRRRKLSGWWTTVQELPFSEIPALFRWLTRLCCCFEKPLRGLTPLGRGVVPTLWQCKVRVELVGGLWYDHANKAEHG
ncbi:hypothetical protein CEXT_568311, partial [Caerostris extrusa]